MIHWPMRERTIVRLEDGELTESQAHWGLVPFWAKDLSIGRKCFNARSETVATLPSFRVAFKESRCLLVGTGYGEWADIIEEKEKRKQAVKFTVDEGKPFAFAGLWSRNTKVANTIDLATRSAADPYMSCTMLTCEPNAMCGEVHSRMPVILDRADWAAWLDPDAKPDDLQALLKPFDPERMAMEYVTLPPRGKKERFEKAA